MIGLPGLSMLIRVIIPSKLTHLIFSLFSWLPILITSPMEWLAYPCAEVLVSTVRRHSWLMRRGGLSVNLNKS